MPAAIASEISIWHNLMIVWIVLHYSLGIVAAILAAVAGFMDKDGRKTNIRKLVGLASVVATAVLLFLNPGVMATRYAQAWTKMNALEAKIQMKSPDVTPELISATFEDANKLANP